MAYQEQQPALQITNDAVASTPCEHIAHDVSAGVTFIEARSIELTTDQVVDVVVPASPGTQTMVMVESDDRCWWPPVTTGDGDPTLSLDLQAGSYVMTRFERDQTAIAHRGAVHIWSAGVNEWQNLGQAAPIGLPKSRTAHVLVLLHGLFGTTVADFGMLGATSDGAKLIEAFQLEHDVAVGFDHDTITASPADNAAQLRDLLAGWGANEGITVDVIALGRGASVAKALSEDEAANRADSGIAFRRLVVIDEPATADNDESARQLERKTSGLLAAARHVEAQAPELAASMLSHGLQAITTAVANDDRPRVSEFERAEQIGEETGYFVPADGLSGGPVLGQSHTPLLISEWLGLAYYMYPPKMAAPDPTDPPEDFDVGDFDSDDVGGDGGYASESPGLEDLLDGGYASEPPAFDLGGLISEPQSPGEVNRSDRPEIVVLPSFQGGDVDVPKRGGSRGETAEHEEASADGDPGRVVQIVVMHNGAKRQSFVAGEENTLRVWIGPPPGPDENVAASQDAVPELGESVDLIVELKVGLDIVDRQPLRLPKGRTARTGDCELAVHVDRGALLVTGELAFTVDGRMFEYCQIQGRVLTQDEAEMPGEKLTVRSQVSNRQVIDLTTRTAVDSSIVVAEDDEGNPSMRKFGSVGTGGFDLTDRSTLVDFLADNMFVTTKRLIRRRETEAAENDTTYVPYTDVDDADWLELLRSAAGHGWVLHRSLIDQDFTDPGDRIEVNNLTPNEYLPLEFLYDRGAPSDTATVRAECIAAMAAGDADCGHCTAYADLTDAERDQNPILCPFGFWALRKVIERHGVSKKGKVNGPVATDGAGTVDDLSSVLCGWSTKIRDTDADKLIADMKQTVDDVSFATTWSDWKAKLETNPALLVALPHHQKGDDEMAFLEMGGDDLRMKRDLRQYVQTESSRPILLLLGCETDDSDSLGHPSFARAFNSRGAPVVIATLSKVVGRHAAPFANRLVAELIASHNNGVDIGQVLLGVRRNMFAAGYLMALGVIALGDGDWRVATSAISTTTATSEDTP